MAGYIPISRDQVQDAINDIKLVIADLEKTTDEEWEEYCEYNGDDTTKEEALAYWKNQLAEIENNREDFFNNI